MLQSCHKKIFYPLLHFSQTKEIYFRGPSTFLKLCVILALWVIFKEFEIEFFGLSFFCGFCKLAGIFVDFLNYETFDMKKLVKIFVAFSNCENFCGF
jgi:hypothetical protein